MKIISFLFFLSLSEIAAAQPIERHLSEEMKALTGSVQMQHGIASLCVMDAASGKIIYSINEQTGLVPASNMKIFTCIAALDLLGTHYNYKTEIGYSGNIKDSVLYGDIFIKGYGDPTLGSWRYAQTKPDSIMHTIALLLRNASIKTIAGNIFLDASKFSFNPVPGGWAWDDIGNYYGAGAWGLNWHENQYDMLLQPSAKTGDTVFIKSTDPKTGNIFFVNELKTAAAGTGDNSYIYLPPYGTTALIDGTIPAGGIFTVSGALPEPFTPIASALKKMFADYGFVHKGNFINSTDAKIDQKTLPFYHSLIGTIYSPSLDSIVYWFLKKSVNFYGENFVKTIALEKNGIGSTDDGVEILKNFWQERGIDRSALNVTDGSGLSAQDHVTTMSLVQALQYARTRTWFDTFYNALPVYNNMHMKSGTIGGVKSYAGYHTSAKGRQYIFSIIVNNYDGSTDAIVDKMYAVLDELKK